MDYNNEQTIIKINPFSVASFICGLLSIMLCCTGVLSIPVGALGIIFAILTKRMGEALPAMSRTGIILCCVGMLMGILLTLYALYMVETDPATRALFMEQYKMYNQMY